MIFDVKELQRIEAHSENMVERKLAGAMIAQMNVTRAYEAKLLDANRQLSEAGEAMAEVKELLDEGLLRRRVWLNAGEEFRINRVIGALIVQRPSVQSNDSTVQPVKCRCGHTWKAHHTPLDQFGHSYQEVGCKEYQCSCARFIQD